MIYETHNHLGELCIIISDPADLGVIAGKEDVSLPWMNADEIERHALAVAEFYSSLMRGNQLDQTERDLILSGAHPEAKATKAADYKISPLPFALN